MKTLWKSMVALLIAGSAMGAAVVPAQAHDDYRGRYGWQGDRHDRWDRNGRWDRRDRWDRWDRRAGWDGRRNGWRDDRRRCWTEKRYSRYYGRTIRQRVCR